MMPSWCTGVRSGQQSEKHCKAGWLSTARMETANSRWRAVQGVLLAALLLGRCPAALRSRRYGVQVQADVPGFLAGYCRGVERAFDTGGGRLRRAGAVSACDAQHHADLPPLAAPSLLRESPTTDRGVRTRAASITAARTVFERFGSTGRRRPGSKPYQPRVKSGTEELPHLGCRAGRGSPAAHACVRSGRRRWPPGRFRSRILPVCKRFGVGRWKFRLVKLSGRRRRR